MIEIVEEILVTNSSHLQPVHLVIIPDPGTEREGIEHSFVRILKSFQNV